MTPPIFGSCATAAALRQQAKTILTANFFSMTHTIFLLAFCRPDPPSGNVDTFPQENNGFGSTEPHFGGGSHGVNPCRKTKLSTADD
jgi:hypothetical protein